MRVIKEVANPTFSRLIDEIKRVESKGGYDEVEVQLTLGSKLFVILGLKGARVNIVNDKSILLIVPGGNKIAINADEVKDFSTNGSGLLVRCKQTTMFFSY